MLPIRPITDLINTNEMLKMYYKKLDEAEKQILGGEKLLDGEQVFRKLRQKYRGK